MLQPHPAPWPVVGTSLPCWCFGPSFRALRSRSFNLTSIDPIPCPTVPTGWRPLFSVCHLDKPLLFFPRCALWSFECRILPFFALTIPWWWFNTPSPISTCVLLLAPPSPLSPFMFPSFFTGSGTAASLGCSATTGAGCPDAREMSSISSSSPSTKKIYLPLWLP